MHKSHGTLILFVFYTAALTHPCFLQPVDELSLVWCELLSETLAALWSGSVTSDPDRWLKWSPLSPEEETKKSFRSLLGPSDTVRVRGCRRAFLKTLGCIYYRSALSFLGSFRRVPAC